MGNPLKRRTTQTLYRKALASKRRFDQVFGDYNVTDETPSAEVQRALENLLDKTEALIGSLTPRPAGKEG